MKLSTLICNMLTILLSGLHYFISPAIGQTRQEEHHLLDFIHGDRDVNTLEKWMKNFYEYVDHSVEPQPKEFMQWLVPTSNPGGLAEIDMGHGVFIFNGKTSTGEDVAIIWPATGYNAWTNTPPKLKLARKKSRCPRYCDFSYVAGATSTSYALQPTIDVSDRDARDMMHYYEPEGKAMFAWVYIAHNTIQAMGGNPLRIVIGRKEWLLKNRLVTVMSPVDAGGRMDLVNSFYSNDNFATDDPHNGTRANLPQQR